MSGVGLPLGALMRHGSFGNFWCARVATTMAYQMQAVAIGWQIYDITNSPLDLGLVGLVQFLPTIVFSVAGRAGGRSLRPQAHRPGVPERDRARRRPARDRQRDRVARPRRDPRARVRIRHGAGLRDALDAGAVARHRHAGAAAARHRCFDLGEPDRGDLRPGAGRPALCAGADGGLRDLRGDLRHRQHPGRGPQDGAAHQGARAGDARDHVRRLRLRAQPAAAARRHFARSLRGAGRRRHRAAPDLRPRCSRHRTVGARPAAFGAGGRRARHVGVSRPPLVGRRGRDQAVRLGRGVRRRHRRVLAVALASRSRSARSSSTARWIR